ncbi:hypothetical protein, partial [Microseira wollei]|uniref:hypothetical protein n=1 Tax=Microseira wollei TaxID=467598 RepID=UPI001CFCFEFD
MPCPYFAVARVGARRIKILIYTKRLWNAVPIFCGFASRGTAYKNFDLYQKIVECRAHILR